MVGFIKEAVAKSCSVKKVFLEISQNSQESTCARVCNFIKKENLAQVFSCAFCEIPQHTFSYRTPLVAASVIRKCTGNAQNWFYFVDYS